jgi:RNA ligase
MIKAPQASVKLIKAIEHIAFLYAPKTLDFTDFNEKLMFVKSMSVNDIKLHQFLRNKQLVTVLSELIDSVQPKDFKELSRMKMFFFGAKHYFEAFKDQLSKTYIRYEQEENRVLMHYSPIATYSRDWNNSTRVARGLVVDLDDYTTVVHPYDKFHNMYEVKETQVENLPKVPYEAAVKLDGSEGILYPLKKGGVKVITKGGFNTEQGQFATKILFDKYATQAQTIIDQKLYEKYTIVFEIIYSKEDPNRIVVQYDESDLKVIGVRDLESGRMLTYKEVSEFARNLGFPATEIENVTLEEIMELRKDRENFEGWVVRFANGLYMKIKCEPYLEAHGARFGTSLKAVFMLIKEEKWDDFIATIIPENRTTPEVLYKQLTDFATYYTKNVLEAYESIPVIENQKEFALYVQQNVEKQFQSYMFQLRLGKDINVFKLTWSNFKKAFDEWEAQNG